MDINFEYYKVFYYVAKYKTFSKAAEILYVSQPAISQTIKKLEEQLGANVFYRNRDGINLTEEGKKLYFLIEPSIIMMENANKKFKQFSNLEVGTIKIRTGNTIASEILAEPLIEFMKLYPNIKFEISNGSNVESLKWLAQGDIDIVLLNTPSEIPYSNVDIRPCAKKEFVFAMSPEYAKKYNVKIDNLGDLEKYNLILPRKRATARKVLESIYEEAKDLQNASQISSEEIKAQLAKNGAGICLVEKILVKDELKSGKLIEIKLPKKIEAYATIVTLDRKSISFATKKLVEMIEEKYKE